jgi:uncharacterized SAM-binding protein YcdF (DUF218 family)
MKPGRTAPGPLTALGTAAIVCLVLGFGWFMQVVGRRGDPPPVRVDGVVALTGGAGRVELALRLLAEGHADRLLLSGIGGGAELGTLGRMAGVDTAPLASRITLGRYAASTRGNARETAVWVEQNRIGSLIVVTAAYHMPRALAELRQSLPGVRLYPLAVQPQDSADRGPGLRLEFEEYAKYLLTVAGLSAWLPHREALMPGHPPAGQEE